VTSIALLVSRAALLQKGAVDYDERRMFPMMKLMIPAVLLSALLPHAALAQEGHADVHVAYRDLNLQSPSGVRVLDRRIEWAIAEVCPNLTGLDLGRKLAVYRCRAAKRAEVAGQRAAALEKAMHGTVELAAAQPVR
jgi:UrcA family protein